MHNPDQKPELLGIVPVVPIPFRDDEEIDEDALRRLVDFAVSCKIKAICLPMYGSEFYKLSDEERKRVVAIAVSQARDRIKVIGNCAHGSSRIARSYAEAHAAVGAPMVSIPIPRLFPYSDNDLLDYLIPVLKAVDVPVLVQDFNPGGPTVTPDFVRRLKDECPNFLYIKLEEPFMAEKIHEIRAKTNDRVGVLEGWGALYLMELLPTGIVGSMPGLAIADILQRIFELRAQKDPLAFTLYEKILPQIVFALQNFEFFILYEKLLLKERGVLTNTLLRNCGFTPTSDALEYVSELNHRIFAALEEYGFEPVWRP